MEHLGGALAVTAGDEVLGHTRAQGAGAVESYKRD